MAENNRNRQGSQYDWNDDYNRQQRNDDEPNYTMSENRGYRDSGRSSNMGSGDGSWQSRYERQMNTNREGDFDRYSQRNYGRQGDSDYNFGRGSSGYADFGGDYSRGSSRNLYDRGDQGMGRRDFENRENRIGGANYDRYGDHGRYDQGQSYRGSKGFSSGSNYGRPEWGRSSWGNRDYDRSGYRNRDFGSGDSEERSWWDRTADEVSSWFGDEDAQRRRDHDRNHRGKGPRNYSRSDDRIKEDINDRLSDDPFVDASDIDVTVTSGEVTLTGTVDHRSTKRRAEDLAEAVSGVKNVENRLRVTSGPQTSSFGTSATQTTSAVPGSERGRKESGSFTK